MKKLFALILTIALILTASSALAAGLEGKTIGFINAGPDDYYAAFGDALVVLAKANGAEVIELNSNYSSETELANCQDLIVKGVDAIAVITAGEPVPPPPSRPRTKWAFRSSSSSASPRLRKAPPIRAGSPTTTS